MNIHLGEDREKEERQEGRGGEREGRGGQTEVLTVDKHSQETWSREGWRRTTQDG